ncbi:MAG: 30S ribosomal protein S7 [Candidatus Latescibacteria bacterium]|nr:30S ribosomal protein S7 [Candidatus Latescibacterota bacterium]
MPRRRQVEKRQILPDPKYHNILVARFVNRLLRQGKKSIAEGIFYKAMDIVEKRTNQPGVDVFQKAVENVKPMVMVRSRRVGGANYQVPVEVRPDQRTSLSIRWLITFSQERSEKSMAERLAAELMAAANNDGGAVRRREETHRMAEANRAFAHYRG